MEPLPLEARPFLDALAEDPSDELSRLALADWLEEHGDRRAAWVREAELWAWMQPDAGHPVPRILANLEVSGAGATAEAFDLFDRVGPEAVDMARAWLRESPDERFGLLHPELGWSRPTTLCRCW
jgi:uncharacterized protein (TIGR02996 family)